MTNARLNDLLIDLLRSLIQYANEAWPWTADEAAVKAHGVIEEIGAEQRRSVQQIVNLLDERRHPVDFGVYPDEYTSLHYVSLDYLLDQLLVNQRALVEECDRVARDCRHDPEAASLAESLHEREQKSLSRLQELRATTASPQGATP